MSDKTAIEWTDATWNPVRGCTKVSAGCKNCYAERFAERWRGIPGHAYEQGFDLRLVPAKLDQPLRWKRPRRIFVNSMSDLFHEGVSDEFISAVFGVMVLAKHHTFQVLTKRPERLAEFVETVHAGDGLDDTLRLFGVERDLPERFKFPPDNVILGTSVEDHRVVGRIDALRDVDNAKRFLSIEPLISDVGRLHLGGIHWVIVGGESGPGARPMDADWVRSIRDQCVAAGVPFFFKQWGGVNKRLHGRVLDGRTWDEVPPSFVGVTS